MSDEEILKLFGRNVQKFRTQQGLTQEKLAFKIGFHNTYIGMVERAERKISILAAIRLAKGLGVTLDELIKE